MQSGRLHHLRIRALLPDLRPRHHTGERPMPHPRGPAMRGRPNEKWCLRAVLFQKLRCMLRLAEQLRQVRADFDPIARPQMPPRGI